MAGRSKSSKIVRLYESDSEQISDHEVYILLLLLSGLSYLDGCVEDGEDDHSMEEDDDVGSDEGDNEEDDMVEKAKNLII
ncbi:hypothetical protein F2Q69_00001995 [Brassica cretica]|uniref:Uncharacterized protein n=1 Tax=Brassica cretica TaxID=69181 RepID=A0A8S9PQJ4_BRACR|nr:hypothetical protein F2Q69_00001995 [Brassica cretica]